MLEGYIAYCITIASDRFIKIGFSYSSISVIIKYCSLLIDAFSVHVKNHNIALLGKIFKYKLATHGTSLVIQFKINGNGVKFSKMKTLLILISSAFCAATASDQFSFACARKYFQNEKITDFIVVAPADAGRNELPIQSFFKSLDIESNWPLTVASDIFSAMHVLKNERTKNLILFVSSSADFGSVFANVHLENTRIFIILMNAYPSGDHIRAISRKFGCPMQSQVVFMEKSDHFWKFYKYFDNRCPSNTSESFEIVAKCRDGAVGANFQYLLNDLPVKGKSCPLIVAARPFEPFTYYDVVKGFHNGIDYSIVKTISERLQLKVKFVRSDLNSIG